MKHVLVAVALLWLPTAALAQGDAGPFSGLFGRTVPTTGIVSTTFDLRGSVGAQWDDGESSDGNSVRDTYSGSLGSVVGSGWYQRRTDRVSFDARSYLDYRQSLDRDGLGGTTVDANIRAAFKPTTRLGFDTSAGYFYTPFFQMHPSYVSLPTGIILPGRPYVATASTNYSMTGSAAMSYQYGKRSSVSASVMRRESRFEDQPEYNLTLDGFEGVWRRGLTRDMGLRLGMAHERHRPHAEPGVVHVQNIFEAGLDFNRALSLSRRTTMSFSAGTSAFQREDTGRHYRLIGNIGVMRQMSRTWQLGVVASRGSEFRPGFSEPMFSDQVMLNVSGMLSERVEWITAIGGGLGEFEGVDIAGRFRSYDAGSVVNFALTRSLGLYTQLSYYHYDIPAGIASAALVNRMSRHTVMVGMTAWVPVLSGERGIRDSR